MDGDCSGSACRELITELIAAWREAGEIEKADALAERLRDCRVEKADP
jgi:hypothetical protein